jgi:hypothetical protein
MQVPARVDCSRPVHRGLVAARLDDPDRLRRVTVRELHRKLGIQPVITQNDGSP